jgi:acetylornithine deacetylase/succinyl-diaminopimelate desuccinylase-like protein
VRNQEIKERIFRIVDSRREQIAAYLAEYIQHRSINPEREIASVEKGETIGCQKWLQESLRSFDCFETTSAWQVSSGELNITATMAARNPDRFQSVLFNGHSDVVPVSAEEYALWRGGDPWSGQVYDGAVYGRGACDMKGANAAIIWAARTLHEAGFVPPGQATFTFTIGEESGNAPLGPYSVRDRGYLSDVIIVAEPTNLNVCPAAVGWFFFRIDVKGKASHAASRVASIYPSRAPEPPGVNAIEMLLPIIERLQSLERDWGINEKHLLMTPGNATMNIVQISGGAEQATTPTTCYGVWAAVVSPNRRCLEVREEIDHVVAGQGRTTKWLRENPPLLTVPYLQGFFEPVNTALDHPACEVMLEAVRSAGCPSAVYSCMPTPSDANFFAEEGKPVIVCGPGNLLGNGVHGLDEHLAIDDLVAATKAYAAFMVDYCSLPKADKV